MLQKILIVLGTIGLVIAAVWFYKEGGYEPLYTAVGALAALIAAIFTGGDNNKPTMTQKGGDNSKNYQSGGDMNF